MILYRELWFKNPINSKKGSKIMFWFHPWALSKVWSPYMWGRRWIWNVHPWLSSLQEEDHYVSKDYKRSLFQRVSCIICGLQCTCGPSLCVCAVMQQRRWCTQQTPSLRSATCVSLKCTRTAKTAWVKLPRVVTAFDAESIISRAKVWVALRLMTLKVLSGQNK